MSENEAINRIADNINTKKSVFKFNKISTKDYEGFIIENSFEINRIINYRNSFLPHITGSIRGGISGTQIEIKMRLHWFIIIFIIFWCSFILFTTIFNITAKEISASSFIPFLMLAFVYILTMFGFKSESKKSKEDLKKIFEAK
ncbi:MAG: hypothetical protein EOO19_11700 [Chryseobacterium sp.]|nr:MAG: hypothetical protein EOO19_11700 [Chryseobacterium sp.]